MDSLYNYLPKEIVDYVLADYLLPTEKYDNVMHEIKHNDNLRHCIFPYYYFWSFKIEREKRDVSYFINCLETDTNYLKYNPFPNNKLVAALYNMQHRCKQRTSKNNLVINDKFWRSVEKC